MPVDGTIRAEITKDIVNDVLLYEAAAMVKVRKAVAVRTKDQAERKRMFLVRSEKLGWAPSNQCVNQVRINHEQPIVANRKHCVTSGT